MSGTIDRPLADVGYIGSVTFTAPQRPQEPDPTSEPGHEPDAAVAPGESPSEAERMIARGWRCVKGAWRRA